MKIVQQNGKYRVQATTPKGEFFFIENVNGENFKLIWEARDVSNSREIVFTLNENTNYKSISAQLKKGMSAFERNIASSFKSTKAGDVVQHIKSIFNDPAQLQIMKAIIEDLVKLDNVESAVDENEEIIIEELLNLALDKMAIEKCADDAAYAEAEDAAMKAAATRAKEEDARVEREEAERKAAEEAERARLEAERKAAVVKARLEAERRLAEEKARIAEEKRKAAEEKARMDAERIAKMKEKEARDLAEKELEMERIAEAKRKANAAEKARLEQEESLKQQEKLALQKALIESRKAQLDKIKSKLSASVDNAAADSKIDETIEEHKPEEVKKVESSHFICQFQPKNYTNGKEFIDKDTWVIAESSSKNALYLNKTQGLIAYSIDAKSEINGENIIDKMGSVINKKHYPSGDYKKIQILPSDLSDYAKKMPGFEKFILALACWNPNKHKIESFSEEHFDFQGFRYKGKSTLFGDNPLEGCTLSFESTLDNDFVGKAIEAMGQVGDGASEA